jgi:hypothetical protein
LNQITLESFSHEQVRLMYVAAQVANIDVKIDCAVLEVMKIYRDVIGTAAGLGMIPGASTTNRTAAAISVCRAVAKCFGLPTVDPKTIWKIMKLIIWDDLGHNITTALAEGIAVVDLGASIVWRNAYHPCIWRGQYPTGCPCNHKAFASACERSHPDLDSGIQVVGPFLCRSAARC